MTTPHDDKPPLFTCPRCGELYDASDPPKDVGTTFLKDLFLVDTGEGTGVSTCARCPRPEAETPSTIARLLAYCRAQAAHSMEGRRRLGDKMRTRIHALYPAIAAEAEALPAPPWTRAAEIELLHVLRAGRTNREVPRA